MLRSILVLSFAFSLNSLAAPQVFKGSCSEIKEFVEELNTQLESRKEISVDYCDETFDRHFLGIKSNFKSTLELNSNSGLCQNARYVERRMTKFETPVNLGINFERKIRLLEAYSFVRGPISAVGSVAGKSLTGIYYPVCE